MLKKLLDESELSYYWIGFLVADGHFSLTHRLSVVLSHEDKDHLQKLCLYLNCDLKVFRNTVYLRVMDTITVPKITEKFRISNKKTYNPIKNLILEETFLISFLAGFIDGDGYITFQHGRQDSRIEIKLHSSWYEWLLDFNEQLLQVLKINGSVSKNKNTSKVSLANQDLLHLLKKKCIELELPILQRKWDKIDLSYKKKTIRSQEKKMLAQALENQGLTYSQIAKELQIPRGSIGYLLKKEDHV